MLSVKVHESRLPLLEERFRRVNKKLKNHGQIGYKISGVSLGRYVDTNGEVHEDGLYFDVETDGAAKFDNMEYIGKIDVIDDTSNTIRPYGQISDAEYAEMKSMHNIGCACCNVSRKRNDLYIFRCTETMQNVDTGITYEKGKIYPVGSNCIDKFTGVKARTLIDQLSGEVDLSDSIVVPRNEVPTYVDAKKFMAYAMQVANTRLDDIYSYYTRRSDLHYDCEHSEDIYQDAVDSCITYRQLKGSGDKMQGSIARTALAAYQLCENNYVDKKFFKDDMAVERFQDFMNLSGFHEKLSKMEKTASAIQNTYSEVFSSNDLSLQITKNNADVLTNADYVHKKHVQKLVDVCDIYFLSKGSCAMHERDIKRYEVSKSSVTGDTIINGKCVWASTYTSFYNHQFNANELCRLYDGYPVLLNDCHSNAKPKELFSTVVSFQMRGGYGVLQTDKRFKPYGKLPVKDIDKYVPTWMPINDRISCTTDDVSVVVDANQKLHDDFKTGLDDNCYGSVDNAKSSVKNNVSKSQLSNTDYDICRKNNRTMVEARYVNVDGKKLCFNQQFGTHVFDDTEIRSLIAGDEITLKNYTTRGGKTGDIKGRLSLMVSDVGTHYVGFSRTDLEYRRDNKIVDIVSCMEHVSELDDSTSFSK